MIIYPWLFSPLPFRSLHVKHRKLLEQIEHRCELINLLERHRPKEKKDIYSTQIQFISSCLRLSGFHYEIRDIKTLYRQSIIKKKTLLRKLRTPFYLCRAYNECFSLIFRATKFSDWENDIRRLDQIIIGKVAKCYPLKAKLRKTHHWFGAQAAVQPIYCHQLLETLYQHIFWHKDMPGSLMANKILLALLAHIIFLLILPFEDGNKRLANLLLYSILRTGGMSDSFAIVAVTFFADKSSLYYGQIPNIIRSEGDYSEFIEFALTGILSYANQALLQSGTRHLCSCREIDFPVITC
ncbi:MAG: Fic family protein [Deltaproteobacteria bacterium]|nr:Fic family protein [Deltaproteobacteria bacterium]